MHAANKAQQQHQQQAPLPWQEASAEISAADKAAAEEAPAALFMAVFFTLIAEWQQGNGCALFTVRTENTF